MQMNGDQDVKTPRLKWSTVPQPIGERSWIGKTGWASRSRTPRSIQQSGSLKTGESPVFFSGNAESETPIIHRRKNCYSNRSSALSHVDLTSQRLFMSTGVDPARYRPQGLVAYFSTVLRAVPPNPQTSTSQPASLSPNFRISLDKVHYMKTVSIVQERDIINCCTILL